LHSVKEHEILKQNTGIESACKTNSAHIARKLYKADADTSVDCGIV